MEFESLIRKAVHEEMEQTEERVIGSVLQALKSVNHSTTSLDYHVEASQRICCQLVFADKLPSTIYTESTIEAEMGGPIKIELVDAISKARVTSGPLSSMKIKIDVLDGDLGFEDQENWTEQESVAKVVEGKKDKRPLLIGHLETALKDGVGIFSDLKFTDNSSWIKCRKFRLSARVVTRSGGQAGIKEAISDAIKVKESRAKANEKHHPPYLDDDVYRLERIGKGGVYHKRLADQHICKVKDFLQMHKNNPKELRAILKCSDNCWNKIVEHAYNCDGYDEKPNAVDGHNYQPPEKRSCIQEPLVKSQNDQANELTSLKAEPISTPTTAFSGMHVGSYHASTSSPYKGGLEDHKDQLQLPVEKNNHPIQPSDPMCGDYSMRMDGLQTTCNEDYNMRMDGLQATCSEDYNMRTDGLQATCSEDYNMRTDGLQATCSEDYNMRMDGLQATCSEGYNMRMDGLQATCSEDYNMRMDGLQVTCNEETVTNLAYGMTSQDPMSTCPSVSIQCSDPLCGDYNIRTDGLLATEETVPSLAYGLTSQAPTSTSPSVMVLWEHSNGSHLSSISNDSEANFFASFIESPFDATFEGSVPYGLIWSPGRLLATEETAPSLAYGMTSQAPTSTIPSVTALGERTQQWFSPSFNQQ